MGEVKWLNGAESVPGQKENTQKRDESRESEDRKPLRHLAAPERGVQVQPQTRVCTGQDPELGVWVTPVSGCCCVREHSTALLET